MKAHIKSILHKISFWNLFVGIVIGFGAGVWLVNLLVPNANQLIRMYRMDYQSRLEDGKLKRPPNALYPSADIQVESQ
jgi:hypothetical protein